MARIIATLSGPRQVVVREQDLITALTHLARISGTCEITVHTRGSRMYVFSDLADLLELPNRRRSKITSLELRSMAQSGEYTKIEITSWSGASANLVGDRRFVEHQTALIEELFDRIRPWYALFYKLPFWPMLILSLSSATAYLLGTSFLGLHETKFGDNIRSIFGLHTLQNVGILTNILVYLALARRSLFPETVFLIGDGVRRSKLAETARSVSLSRWV